MANGGRRVVIDDTHPSIIYSTNPPWFIDDIGLMDNVGNFGTPLDRTLHGTKVNGSFSFSFSGTAMDVYGTTIRNSSGAMDPLWNCYVNGVQLMSSFSKISENNWPMCGIGGLLDMNHTFTLNVSTLGAFFWFDYISYLPSPKSALQNDSVLLVPFSDSSLVYDSSWQFWSNLSAVTGTRNATVQFQFTGTSLSWYGIYPRELPIQPAMASFSIDGGLETTFRLRGLSSNASTAYNQLLFRTDVYPHGLHTLIVNFKGSNNTTPLSLAYILLHTGNTPNQTRAMPSPTAIGANADRPSISIAGLVCGAVALCVLIAALLAYFFIKHRQKKVPADFTNPNPAPRVPAARCPTSTALGFDLASSSPYIGIEGAIGEDHTRRLTWQQKLQTTFLAAFNRTPHLGMVAADASTASPTDHRRNQPPPQILSLWARRNRSRQIHQRTPDERVPHRPRMPRTPPMDEYPASGRLESGDAVGEYSGGNIPTSSLSLPSTPAGHGRSTSSAEASYYGGYRTKREMIELERRQQHL